MAAKYQRPMRCLGLLLRFCLITTMNTDNMSPIDKEAPTTAAATVLTPPAPQPAVAEKPAALQLNEQDQDIAHKTQLHWRHLLTGDAATVPDEVRRRAGADAADLSPDERDYRIYSTINRSWYADHRDTTKEKVRAEWPALRRQLAQELEVADDEREVFMALSARHDEEKLRTVARTAYERSYQAALCGKAMPDLQDITQPLPPEYRHAAHTVAAQAAAEAQGVREQYWPLVTELAAGMNGIAALEEDFVSAPQFLAAAPSLVSAVDTLAELPEQERQLVLALAVQESRTRRDSEAAEEEEEGLGSRLVRGLRRGAASLGMGMLQGVNHLGIATLDNIGARLNTPTGHAMQQTAAAWDKRLQTLREIRHATQQELIPLVGPNTPQAEDYLLHAAESIPAAVLACAGGAGFATLTAAGMGDAVAEARLRSPETPQQFQLAAGVMGGAVQASIYMGISRIGGQLLEKSVNNFLKARGHGGRAFSWAALNSMAGMTAEGVKLMLAGKVATAAEAGLQELASKAAGTASGINWQEFGDNLTDVEANMREAAALLPFLLIGSGRVALRHFRAPHQIVGDGTRLLDWGVPEKDVTQILNERDINRKGELLRQALTGSKMWSGPGFIIDAIKALRLLNGDYFKGFESPEVVRDFLKLPAEASVIKRADYGERTHEAILNTPNHAIDRYGYKGARHSTRFKNALALWDEWWTRSHINAYSSRIQLGEWQLRSGADTARYERTTRYLQELNSGQDKVPRRMQPLGTYSPNAERERRALLQDRVADLQDLSYQFLMNVNSLESMAAKDIGLERMKKDAERTREEFLGNIGKTLVNAGLGMPTDENMAKFCDWFQGYYMRKKYRERTRGAHLEWIRDVPPDFLRKMSEHAPQHEHLAYTTYPELLEAYRIYLGVRSNTELLIDLLPMTEDFQTALSRGMSPAQAYSYLAERELGYKAENLKNFPTEQVEQSINITPMEEYTRMNEARCRDFMLLTGATLEEQTGDDGQCYRRLRRPDGSFSRWHESAAFAMNDVAANAALTFLPLGKGIHRQLATQQTDLTRLPLAGDHEFSGFDQLCHRAMQDLTVHWMESAPYLQPGLRTERLRYRFMHNRSYGSGISPVYHADGAEEHPYLTFDIHTTATPVGLATARFFTFWQRILNSSTIQPQHALSFLELMGQHWEQEVAALPPPETSPGHLNRVADLMARFTLQYFMVKLPQLNLPPSVKEWVGYAAFCPPVEDGQPGMPSSVQLGKNHSGIIRWSNRRVAAALREQLQQIDTLRREYADTALPDGEIHELMQRALGLDAAHNAEQAWCYHYAGATALQNAPQYILNILKSPLNAWLNTAPEEQHQLREYMQAFLEATPPITVREGEDYMSAAMANLDAVLAQHPQLHYLSPAGGNRERILTLTLPEQTWQTELLPEEPAYREQAFPYTRAVQERAYFSDTAAADYPQLNTPQVQHAMQFLDMLRAYPGNIPYATPNGIYWRELAYGGKNGKPPAGLEQHRRVRPLASVIRLLKEVHELCETKQTDFINICGIPLPKLSEQELACPAIQGISVYRQMQHGQKWRSLTHLCRLMPGDRSAPSHRERSPYVTEIREGIYLGDTSALSKVADPISCMVPLQQYAHLPHRKYGEANTDKRFADIVDHALDNLSALADKDASFMEHRFCGGVSLTELLMRLFEDSNFGGGILGRAGVQEQSPQALRLLRLAADLISCIAAPQQADHPQAVKAFKRLQNTVQRLQKDKPQRSIQQRLLLRSTQLLKEKIDNATANHQ